MQAIDDKVLAMLLNLAPNWDSYGAAPIRPQAVETVKALKVVPVCTGGVQIELCAGGADLEIEIGPDGQVNGVYFEKA